jgi:putative copper export protein
MDDGVDLLTVLTALLKLPLYLSALAAAGIALVCLLGVVEPDGRKALLQQSAWLAVMAVVLSLCRFGISVVQMGDLSMVAMVWQFQSGYLLAMAGGTGFLALGMLLTGQVAAVVLLSLGTLALCASFGLTGHSQGLAEPAFWPAMVTVHVMLASFWLAALVVLWPGRTAAEILAARAEAFGRIAMIAVPVLVVAGLALALRLGGGLTALAASTYGWTLLVKAIVVSAAMLVGAHNKLVVTPLLRSDPSLGRAALSRALFVDGFLFLAALAAITLATTLFGPA